MESDKEIGEIAAKMKTMTESLNEKLFQNPIKDVQRAILKEALELKQIIYKNINELSKQESIPQVVSACNSEEYNTVKTALEHKQYQVERLKEAFNEYEKKTEDELGSLKVENEKLKYRIKILLRELEATNNKTTNIVYSIE